jgi:hypothetical protein
VFEELAVFAELPAISFPPASSSPTVLTGRAEEVVVHGIFLSA